MAIRAPKQTAATEADDSVDYLSRDEAYRLFDQQARRFLNMSGDEFARQYRAGTIAEPHRLAVARVAILLPLIEPWIPTTR